MAKKLTTEEILKAARAQAGGADGQSAADSSAPPPPAPSSAAPKEPSAAPEASAAAKSTKDILAAARGQASAKAGGEGAAAGPASKSGAGPKSTSDILAAARAQSASGAKPAAGAPSSTKDILAAARAQSGSGAAAPATSTPAAPKAAAKAAAAKTASAARAAADRPSVQEMLKAAREGRAVAESVPAKPAAAAALVVPQRPAAPAPAAVSVGEPRRGFLAKLGAGFASVFVVLFGSPFRAAWTSFSAVMGLWGLDMARFMMPNVLVEPPSKFKVGPPSDYAPSSVSTKWTAQYGVWIVRDDYKGKDIIYALLTVCTHLGCTPNWLEGERKFKCPCHGSGFYITGINFEGPAPRPLERMAIRTAEDGLLEVDKSRKFQEELGQWADPASFVPVV